MCYIGEKLGGSELWFVGSVEKERDEGSEAGSRKPTGSMLTAFAPSICHAAGKTNVQKTYSYRILHRSYSRFTRILLPSLL